MTNVPSCVQTPEVDPYDFLGSAPAKLSQLNSMRAVSITTLFFHVRWLYAVERY